MDRTPGGTTGVVGEHDGAGAGQGPWLETRRLRRPSFLTVGAASVAAVAAAVAVAAAAVTLTRVTDAPPTAAAAPAVTVTVTHDGLAPPSPVILRSGSAVTLPFKVGFLPAGLRIVSAMTETVPEGAAIGLADTYGVQDGAPFEAAMTIWVADISDPDLVFCSSSPGAVRQQNITLVTIGSHTGCVVEEQQTPGIFLLHADLERGHVEILLDADHVGRYTAQELVQIASSVTPAASLTDPSTWFEVAIEG